MAGAGAAGVQRFSSGAFPRESTAELCQQLTGVESHGLMKQENLFFSSQ